VRAWASGRRLIERIAFVGVAPGDSDDVRLQKATLTLSAVASSLLSFIWVTTYLVLGLPLSAAIPAGYQVATAISLIVFARTKTFGPFRWSQILLILILPFLLQWSLGGYANSSALSVWGLVGVFGALFFFSAAEAIPWFMLFVGLTIFSGIIDGRLAESAPSIPAGVQVAFFVLNILAVALVAYLLLQFAVRTRDAALRRSDQLLLNVLPGLIAERLKHRPGVIAERHSDVSVLFADVAGFTPFVDRTSADDVVGFLDEVFSAFDVLSERHGVEKIKTIGDAYMAASGLPEPRTDHAQAVAAMALEMLDEFERICRDRGFDLAIRIGIASGPVIAGVIGRRRFIYDLWGDTVNTASRMESQGVPGRVQVTEHTYHRLVDQYRFEERGEIAVKGKGRISSYLIRDQVLPVAN
jgi:adenylate cyclase